MGPQLDTLWRRNSQELNSCLPDVPEAMLARGHQHLVTIRYEISFHLTSLRPTASHIDHRVICIWCKLLRAGGSCFLF